MSGRAGSKRLTPELLLLDCCGRAGSKRLEPPESWRLKEEEPPGRAGSYDERLSYDDRFESGRAGSKRLTELLVDCCGRAGSKREVVSGRAGSKRLTELLVDCCGRAGSYRDVSGRAGSKRLVEVVVCEL